MKYDADVLIIGAGPAGLGAAVMSARSGMKTIVAEAYGVPGGMAVIAEVQPFMISFHNGKELDYPVYQEWKEAMNKYLSAAAVDLRQTDKAYAPRNINKEAAALAAEDLLLEAGVKILYHHRLVEVEVEDRNIKSVTLHSKSGMEKITARIYIDCTGDGDLAALAGCKFDMGDEKGNCQPMTLCFKLGNVNIPYINKGEALNLIDPEWRKELNEQYDRAVKDGILHCDREDVLLFPFKIQSGNIIHFNTTRVVKHSVVNGKELSDAEIEARRQMREIFFWLRSKIEGFENAEILSMGIQIGVRESRRIHGEFTLKKEHFESAAKFPDAIARSNYHIDIHSPNGSGTYRQSMLPGEYYEIPYRCIVPVDCDNLLIGGRPVSADMAMHSSLRIMPTAISIGQAAGCAAAMAVEEKRTPRQLNGVSVRQKLKQLGALLTLVLALTGFNLYAAAGNDSLSKHSGRIFFTRHAQRAAVQAPSFDPPLTPLGREQAKLLAAELKKRNFRG
ncbi:MAG: FAD-dependent oxidoreductase, partial [Lentisphaeria bacterium]|nr:FAD-dependent oxidoreductase [Lentisphaeria bacterium]